jgi:hypothetical protein
MDSLDRFADAMCNADFILIDGEVFRAGYLRVPDEGTVADDVVLEASHGEHEVALTRADIDGAEALEDGVYRLRSGSLVRFLSTVTVH